MGEILLFLGEFEERLILQGFDGFLGWNWMIFSMVVMGENGVKWAFCRTRYRTQNGGRGVDGTDMPFLASGCLF